MVATLERTAQRQNEVFDRLPAGAMRALIEAVLPEAEIRNLPAYPTGVMSPAT